MALLLQKALNGGRGQFKFIVWLDDSFDCAFRDPEISHCNGDRRDLFFCSMYGMIDLLAVEPFERNIVRALQPFT